MTDINSVTLLGRLTKDAELKSFSNGSGAINFSVAVNRSVKKGDKWEDEVSFLNVKQFTKNGDKLCSMLKKGKQVAVSGSVVQERWEKDGKQNSMVVIYANSVQLIGKSEDKPAENKESFQDDFPNW